MAPVTTTGLVGYIKLNATEGSSYAFFEVQDASTNPPTPETFFIWAGDPVPPGGPELDATFAAGVDGPGCHHRGEDDQRLPQQHQQ